MFVYLTNKYIHVLTKVFHLCQRLLCDFIYVHKLVCNFQKGSDGL